MQVFIALYRGINVGGKNSVKMESLRALHEQLGHQGVKSYVQSGNVVFSASGIAAEITRNLAAGFGTEFGFVVKVIVVSAKLWRQIVKDNPYSAAAAEKPQTVHAVICEGDPDAKQLKTLLIKTGGSEEFTIKKRVIYLHAPDGFGTSKFAAGMEQASGVSTTVRNWRTMEILLKMSTDECIQ